MKKYKLNKVFDEGVTYRAEKDKAYLITAAGTDSTEKATIFVNGAPVGEILDEIAPKEKTNTNLLGPVNLSPLPIVVPPDKPFKFEGATDSSLRLKGNIIVLEPGEVIPGDLVDRYKVQTKYYVSYIRGELTVSGGASWAAGIEKEVINFTCPVKEKWTLRRFFGGIVKNVGGGALENQFEVRIYVEDAPLDIIETAMGKQGIEIFGCHLPPKSDVNYETCTLEDKPIKLTEGINFKVKCKNISGSSLEPTSGNNFVAVVNVVAEKEIL